MTKPVILTVDDDPAVLGAIERDLRRHYRADYRVMKAASGTAGLEAARELAARNTPIALFLVDQQYPACGGMQLGHLAPIPTSRSPASMSWGSIIIS